MTILESIILIAAITVIALFFSYYMQRGTKTMQEFKDDYYDNEEVQEVAELVQELYNKDLRPIAAKKASKTIDEELVIKATGTDEPYVPIENSTEPAKPKKKRKYYPKKPKTSI
jgi:hypothetical protein